MSPASAPILIRPGVCIDCRPLHNEQQVDVKLLKGVDVAGKAVLLCTGWDIYWGTDGYAHYPFLGRDAAEYLRDSGAKLVGVDYLAIDSQRFRYVLMRLARNRVSLIWLLVVPTGAR